MLYVYAVVVGVAALLALVFLVVSLKFCWVWWNYKRRKFRRPPHPDYQTYTATPRAPWPADYTYSTYENQQIDMELLRNLPEPYVIESPSDLGKIQMSVEHQSERNTVTLGIAQAKGIICKSNAETAVIYLQVNLSAGGKVLQEQKLTKQKMAFDPQFNKELTFHLEEQEFNSVTALVQLMELDSFSNTHLIGQVLIPLCKTDISLTGPKWYELTVAQEVCFFELIIALKISLEYSIFILVGFIK